MPVVNMTFSLEILLNARNIKKSILKEGLEGWEKVYENLDNITINTEENINKEEKVKYEEIRKQFVTKSYDKMTNEEKLEFLKREKAFLENKAKSEEIVIKKKIL